MCLHSVTGYSPLPNHNWQITALNQRLCDIILFFNATGNIWNQTLCFEYFEFEFSERSIANGCDCSLTAGNTHRLTHVWTHVCCPRRSTVLMLASPPVLHTSRLTYFHTSILPPCVCILPVNGRNASQGWPTSLHTLVQAAGLSSPE